MKDGDVGPIPPDGRVLFVWKVGQIECRLISTGGSMWLATKGGAGDATPGASDPAEDRELLMRGFSQLFGFEPGCVIGLNPACTEALLDASHAEGRSIKGLPNDTTLDQAAALMGTPKKESN